MQLGVGAVTLYLAHDAASDAALYAVCKREAEARVAACERAQEVLGPPVRFGPWWDASVTSQGGGKLVTAQFVLRGERCSADARVRMVRPAVAETHWTAPSALLYCSPLGPAVAWRLITADVTLVRACSHSHRTRLLTFLLRSPRWREAALVLAYAKELT